jgi:IS5 family transposase
VYKDKSAQPEFEDFYLPFGGRLRSDNRWVRLAKLFPWDEVETIYAGKFKNTKMGAPAKPARVAVGALIIKERTGFTDEELVLQIQENPYLQYFLGYSGYNDNKPFDPSMMVHFRKRISLTDVAQINETLGKKYKELQDRIKEKNKKKKDDDKQDPPNSGKLIMDATCAPADIAYPTDLGLLNDAREKTEKIIDILHTPLVGEKKKVRTYRWNARRDYLKIVKKRKPRKKDIRKAIGKQLRYLKRNLKHIETLVKYSSLSLLSKDLYRKLLVIHEVYRQQLEMYKYNKNKIDSRIVSLSQPHVRPIVRGKAGKSTEFGAKLSISVIDGYVFLEHLSWENYNESTSLVEHVERYKERFGCYPESLHVDQIYRTRDNLKYCKENGIRVSGKPLGRPPTLENLSPKERKSLRDQIREDEGYRNGVEGKFGQGKRRFGLGRITAKRADTSEVVIAICFLVMNLEKILQVIFCLFVFSLYKGCLMLIQTIKALPGVLMVQKRVCIAG